MKKYLFWFIVLLITFVIAAYFTRSNWMRWFSHPLVSEVEIVTPTSQELEQVEIVAENLTIPWELAFLPNGEMLVTERPGNLLIIQSDRKAIPIGGVTHTGEGGLLGLALHPDFSSNKLIYLYFTTQENGQLMNRVERYKLENNQLDDRTVIIDGIKGATIHDGGRIAFGPDGYLYVTTGDGGNEESAQDKSSLNGKILRIGDDGRIPDDNPFNNAVYSYGHRNSQGITWDKNGRLWATEHGRSGVSSGLDELNLIEKGQNYGWPTIQGSDIQSGMRNPVIHSGDKDTWAPAGVTGVDGYLLFAGLRGQSIYVADITNMDKISVKAYFKTVFGRIRTIKEGPTGDLYILTNNTDGRGTPTAQDDKIIKIKRSALHFDL